MENRYSNSLVAIFENRETAGRAREELLRSGVERRHIELTTDEVTYDAASGGAGLGRRQEDQSGGGISGFFQRLFGGADDEDRSH